MLRGSPTALPRLLQQRVYTRAADAIQQLPPSGIRSSALRMGEHIRSGVAVCYLLALIGWSLAIWSVRPQGQALIALAPAGFHLAFQVATFKKDGSNALGLFRSNKLTGMLVMAACLVVGTAA